MCWGSKQTIDPIKVERAANTQNKINTDSNTASGTHTLLLICFNLVRSMDYIYYKVWGKNAFFFQ